MTQGDACQIEGAVFHCCKLDSKMNLPVKCVMYYTADVLNDVGDRGGGSGQGSLQVVE